MCGFLTCTAYLVSFGTVSACLSGNYHCATNQSIQVLDHDLVFRAGISRDPSDLGLSEAKVSSNTLKCFVFSQQTCDWS